MRKSLLSSLNLVWFISLLCSIYLKYVVAETDLFSMIVIADFHGAETFSYNPDPRRNQSFQNYKSTLSYIHETYGGEVVLLPGDSNTGKWFETWYLRKFFNDKSAADAVYQAGINCYSTLRELFNQAGYYTLLMAIGDHELGDNEWFAGSEKVKVLEQFRQSFRDGFNTNKNDGSFYYNSVFRDQNIAVPSTPWGTDHKKLSYAYQYKNVLVVTIDIYEQRSNNVDYLNKKEGRGGEGTVTGTMTGVHLEWFEKILKIARESSPSIKHIIVQSHLPVKGPVRKVKSSTMNVDDGVFSDFWKVMVKYNVDIYLAGEVHSTTAMKDNNSNLVQIVSRGNKLNSFLKIEVEDDMLRVRHYNEVGLKPQNNNNYEQNGELLIDKSGNTTDIVSSGALDLLDSREALLYFDFEEIVPLGSRQVTALIQTKGSMKIGLVANSTYIRRIKSTRSMPNLGKFGRKW